MGISLLVAVGLFIIAILLFVPFRFSADPDGEMDKGETAIIAHRGASALAPENTMPAIEKAIAIGVDYIDELLIRGIDERGTIKDHPTALNDAFELGKRLAV